MDERMRELIAIGASVGAHCQPCLTYHIGKARDLGVDDEAIRAANETGHMVEGGAMHAMKRFTEDAIAPPVGEGAKEEILSGNPIAPKEVCGFVDP